MIQVNHLGHCLAILLVQSCAGKFAVMLRILVEMALLIQSPSVGTYFLKNSIMAGASALGSNE